MQVPSVSANVPPVYRDKGQTKVKEQLLIISAA